MKAPVLSLTVPEIPDEDLMKKLDIDNADFPSFVQCMEILNLQTQGVTLSEACKQVNLPRRTFYESKWQDLMAKARRVMTGYLLQGVTSAAQQVYEEWPNVIKELIHVAKNGQKDGDKVDAAELLYQMYIQPVQEAPKDDSKEAEYLKKPKNYNPLMPIHILSGGTLVINNAANTTDDNPDTVIDTVARPR